MCCNLCDGLSIKKVKIIWDGGKSKPMLYKDCINTFFIVFKMWNLIWRVLHLSMLWGTGALSLSDGEKTSFCFPAFEISYCVKYINPESWLVQWKKLVHKSMVHKHLKLQGKADHIPLPHIYFFLLSNQSICNTNL